MHYVMFGLSKWVESIPKPDELVNRQLLEPQRFLFILPWAGVNRLLTRFVSIARIENLSLPLPLV
jgi:hypothetical protein